MKLAVQTDDTDIDIAVKQYLAAKGMVAVERTLMNDIAAFDCTIGSANLTPAIKWHIYYKPDSDSYHRL